MNILVFNHYQTSNKYSSSSRYYSLAQEWANQGHNVTIVSASFSHLYNDQPIFKGLVNSEIIDGVRYVLLKTPAYEGNGGRRSLNMLAYLSLSLVLLPWFIYWLKPRIVMATSVYLADSIIAKLISRLGHAKFIREIRDIWPLSLFELGALKQGTPKARALAWLERFSVLRAEHVVSTLPFAYDHLKTLGLPPDKFTFIPMAMIPCTPKPTQQEIPQTYLYEINIMRSRFRCLIGFTGSIGHGDTLDVLIPAAAEVQDDGIGFILVGDGVKRATYMAQIANEGIRNVLFLPRTTRRNCAAIMSLLDGLYLGWEAKPLYRFGLSPNRMLDYMQSQRPIIHAISIGNDDVQAAGCGISVPSNDPLALASAFRQLADTPQERRIEMGEAALAFVTRHNDPATLAVQFLSIFNAISPA